ncbi:MAG: hypothetical protein AABX17_04325 [Nanoarchaeota archaeon]
MVIGVDCDEVIFPLLPSHCAFLNDKYALNLDWRKFTSYNFWEHYGKTRGQAVQDFIEFTSTDEFMKVMPIEGSQEGIRELKKLDKLYIITSRTDNLKDKTNNWLEQHFQGIFSGVVFGNIFSNNGRKKISKRQLCSENNISLLLEDHWDYALDVSQDIPVVLFDKPWNQDKKDNSGRIIRVYSWKEAIEEARKFY